MFCETKPCLLQDMLFRQAPLQEGCKSENCLASWSQLQCERIFDLYVSLSSLHWNLHLIDYPPTDGPEPSPSRSQARAPQFHMHPLLSYTRLHHAPISYDVAFTPSARTVINCTMHSPSPRRNRRSRRAHGSALILRSPCPISGKAGRWYESGGHHMDCGKDSLGFPPYVPVCSTIISHPPALTDLCIVLRWLEPHVLRNMR